MLQIGDSIVITSENLFFFQFLKKTFASVETARKILS